MSEHEAPAFNRKLGGHGVAAILGVHPWMKPIDVYTQCVADDPEDDGDEEPVREPTPEQAWGLKMERPILEWGAAKLTREDAGIRAVAIDVPRMDDPLHDWLAAAPDGLALSIADLPRISMGSNVISGRELAGPELLERAVGLVSAKQVGWYNAKHWGEPGSDEVPEYAIIQEHVYMGVLTMPVSHVAASISGSAPRHFVVPFDRELWGMILEESARWWTKHVLACEPPAPDGTPKYERYIRDRMRRHGPSLRKATQEEHDHAYELRRLLARQQEIETRIEVERQALMAAIAESAGLETDIGKITWKRSKDSTAAIFNSEMALLELCTTFGLNLDQQNDLRERHTERDVVVKHGSRRFLVPRSWSKPSKDEE